MTENDLLRRATGFGGSNGSTATGTVAKRPEPAGLMSRDLNWDLPYPSRRVPVFARNVVAATHPLAAQAGLRMLLRGGNAVDAILATAIALTVVEPISAGIGADTFAIIWDGSKLHGLNASGRSPRALDVEYFERLGKIPERGWDSVTVPGGVAAWAAMSEKFGRLPFRDLFAPAIEYARAGFHRTPTVTRQWRGLFSTYKDYPDIVRSFYPGGKPPEVAELFSFRDQADTLEIIAETNGESFYRGALAEKIIAHARAAGATLSLEDLAAHKVEWVEPLTVAYHGLEIVELPPNGQGLAALIALGILDRFDLSGEGPESAHAIHLQVEAMKLAFADVYAHVADPCFMLRDAKEFLQPAYLAERARMISAEQARYPTSSPQHGGGTTYISAADQHGVMVSYIQSNGAGFGSGIVVPGTGISLQSRGRSFTLEPGHPNRVAAGKRPFHTNIPGMAMKNGKPLACFGLMGWNMQPQAHVQFVVRLADHRQNPQAIIDAPRWRIAMLDPAIVLEPGIGQETTLGLESRGHRIIETETFAPASTPYASAYMFGGGQMIYRLEDGYVGASDGRRDGQAVGF
jgi:gamma-glutamyltranspeptidase / glutathione hydrolase